MSICSDKKREHFEELLWGERPGRMKIIKE